MLRNILAIVVVLGLIASTATAIFYIRKSAALEQSVAVLESSLKSKDEKLKELKKDNELKTKIISFREKKRRAAEAEARRLKIKLREALSDDEKKCYTAPVPPVIIDSIIERVRQN